MSNLAGVSKREVGFLVSHFIMFFLIPYIPRKLLILTDNLLVRLVLLAWLVSSAYVSPLVAIATFIIIALLFVERNKYKVNHIQSMMELSSADSPAIQQIVSPPTAPPQPPFEDPSERSIPFMPQDDTGDDSFAPVDKTMNEKIPLPTEKSNEGVQKAIQQLYQWVNPNIVQEGP